MVKPPQPIALSEAFRFRPFPHWDPVPDWVLSHLDSRVIRQIAAVQMRFERQIQDLQGKASAEIEKLISG